MRHPQNPPFTCDIVRDIFRRQLPDEEPRHLIGSIEALPDLQVRFGNPDAGFLDLVQQADLPALSQTLEAAKTAENLDELRTILRSPDTARS